MAFRQLPILKIDALLGLLSTITSLVFREFVLELGPSRFHTPSWEHWGCWTQIDGLLERQFARYGSFRLVVRTEKLRDMENFEYHTKEAFPSLARRGRVHFETSDSIENHWPP